MKHTIVAMALVLTVGAVGCSDDSRSGTATKPPQPTVSGPSSPSPSPTPPPSPLALSVGQETTFSDTEVTMRVAALGLQIPAAVEDTRQPEDAGAPVGYVWAALDVRLCVDATSTDVDVSVSDQPWSLAYADGSRIQADAGYHGLVRPAFPLADTVVPVGDCLRGNILFEVPPSPRPARVVYAGTTPPIDWAVS
jgi:hypothetical protein